MIKKIALVLIVVVLVFLLFGSKPDHFEVDPIIKLETIPVTNLDEYIQNQESSHKIRPGNEAQIVWADSIPAKTNYSLVYLHGFSASHMEGNPVHRALAKKYGMNLYLTRLHEHGLIGDQPLDKFEADKFVESTKQAINIGHALGEKVIVIGTSTGATPAIYLAAHNPALFDILLFFAPNIDVADPRSFLLTYPWGKELAEFLEGDRLKQGMSTPEFDKYWYPTYCTSSAVELLSLIENTMTEDIFSKIQQPIFVSYYYQNEEEKDDIISTKAIENFYDKIGTPANFKRLVHTPKSGNHVTISSITSKDIRTPFDEVCKFLEEVCKIEVVNSSSSEKLLGLVN